MKRPYIGWLVVIAAAGLGLLVVALSPKSRHAETAKERVERIAKQALAQGPAPDPGQGRVTGNLERALRLDLPVVAIFTEHKHEHIGRPEQLERARRERAEHQALAKLAADYNGTLAVVEVSPARAPASVVRSKVTVFPTTIIFGADNRELWRQEGRLDLAAVRARLKALRVRPGRAPAAPSRPRTQT